MSVARYCQQFGEIFQEILSKDLKRPINQWKGRRKCGKMSANKGQRHATYDPNLVEVKAKVS